MITLYQKAALTIFADSKPFGNAITMLLISWILIFLLASLPSARRTNEKITCDTSSLTFFPKTLSFLVNLSLLFWLVSFPLILFSNFVMLGRCPLPPAPRPQFSNDHFSSWPKEDSIQLLFLFSPCCICF